ncbi:PhzF family phenazine biosynthesis protein [Demequina soli]|uniref:PhzF family phenazine biosynthesis protein n=1 Tax=Demequina soli TaxID=1638987 RepID=UPI00078112E2|nr:PhzF family phenazine biosynthesis protein [Demequina soli]
MTTHPFRQVDVFGSGPYSGNPVAVILEAEGLTDAQMADISSWTNLSECTFVLPPTTPDADYRVRIFTLRAELPFAGHPTLGTARAWLDAGGVPRDAGRVVQECGVGLVEIRRDGDALAFAAPAPLRTGEVDEAYLAEVCAVLGIGRDRVVAARWVDNGPGWVGIELASAEEVRALAPDATRHPGEWFIGVVGPQAQGADTAVEVRAFFTSDGSGMREDPVTGSLNASLAQWMVGSGRLSAPYVAAQGTMLGRAGRVSIAEADGEVWVGGATHVAIRGEIEA